MSNKTTMQELWAELKETDDVKELETVSVAKTIYDLVSEFTRARAEKGYTQRDLAKITGIKQSAIARFETLNVIPRLDTLAKIAYHLELSLNICSKLELPEIRPTLVYVLPEPNYDDIKKHDYINQYGDYQINSDNQCYHELY